MYISHILYPVRVLGPGNRIGIWMAGCIHHCPGCSNPELWAQEEKYHTDISTVMELIHLIADQHPVDGFTITGGDPFCQPEALRILLPRLRAISEDILVYTGFLYEELPPDLTGMIAVVIDGKYDAARNTGALLRGSDNQRIIMADAYRARYTAYLESAVSSIQNFSTRDGVISVGIHRPGYEDALRSAAAQYGLEETDHG
ncbi:MAG: 4Fe-4S single cluster domain-containing protein [Aristaeellaceae bacterium]